MTQLPIAIQIDDIDSLDTSSDTSLVIAAELCKRRIPVFLYTPHNLTYSVEQNAILAAGQFYDVAQKQHQIIATPQSEQMVINIAQDLSSLFIRQNPPFDMQYISNLYKLRCVEQSLRIHNSPSALLLYPEKMLPIYLKCNHPKTIITSNVNNIIEFINQYHTILIKPLYGYGGQGIIKLSRDQYKSVAAMKQDITQHLHAYKQHNSNHNNTAHHQDVIVQQFVNNVEEKGDWRIIVVNGKILTYFNRIPKNGSFLANMAQGASVVANTLEYKVQKMCQNIAMQLKNIGIFFAGIDVINDFVIEINVTSPTGLAQANALYNKSFEIEVVNALLD